MSISIVLADDHPVLRQGMRAVLGSEQDFLILGEANDGVETLQLVKRLEPDVLILDLLMPALNGLEVLRVLKERSTRTRVLVYSVCDGNTSVLDALRSGAQGYVLKGSGPHDLVKAVRETAAGRRYLSPPLSDRVVDALLEQARIGAVDPHDTLTAREREVLQLVAEGKTSAQIAVRLHISQRTVENHRAKMMQKLALKNQSELVRYALRRGLIALQD